MLSIPYRMPPVPLRTHFSGLKHGTQPSLGNPATLVKSPLVRSCKTTVASSSSLPEPLGSHSGSQGWNPAHFWDQCREVTDEPAQRCLKDVFWQPCAERNTIFNEHPVETDDGILIAREPIDPDHPGYFAAGGHLLEGVGYIFARSNHGVMIWDAFMDRPPQTAGGYGGQKSLTATVPAYQQQLQHLMEGLLHRPAEPGDLVEVQFRQLGPQKVEYRIRLC